MKKITFLIVALLIGVQIIQAQETVTIERFEGKNITGINASGAFEINIIQGKNTGAKVTIPSRFKENLVFNLNNSGTIELGFRGNIHTKNNEKFIADIVCSSLTEVDLSGACKVNINEDFSTQNVEFDMSGASHVQFNSVFHAAHEIIFDLSGAAKILGKIETPRLKFNMSGASDIKLSGNATYVLLDASGASKVNLSELNVETMTLDISGASDINVNVSGVLKGEISGASKVYYSGSPQLNVETSGASKIRGN